MTAPPFWERGLTIKVDHEALHYMHAKLVDVTQRINGIPALVLTLMRRSAGPVERWDQVNEDAERCAPGKPISLHVALPGGRGDVLLFDGIVVAQRISWDGPNPEITVKAVHPLQKLIGQPRSRVYQGKTDQAVIAELIGAHAVTGHIEVAGPEHEQLLQWQSTDWHWLRRRMRACGVWLLPHMEHVDCVAPSLSYGAVHQIVGDGARTDGVTHIAGAEWHVDNRALAARIDASCWSVGEQRIAAWTRAKPTKLGSGGLDPGRVQALTSEPWRFFDAVPLTPAEIQLKADGQLMAQEMAATQARIVLYADDRTVRYRLGETIEISRLGSRQNGRAIISGIRHQWQHGSFMTTIHIGMDDRVPIDVAPLPSASALTVGVVAKYEPDQMRFDRIRITLPTLGDHIIWARFAKPYASTRRGFHFYPEPNDEVLVSFIEDDPRFPVVLGATHNPINAAPAAGDQRAEPWTWKGWVAADEKGKTLSAMHFGDQGICLETPTGVLSVGVGLQGEAERTNVRIDEEGLDAKASVVNISATKKMTVEGVEALDLIGTKIDLKNKR
jgi:hypothetical protein